MRTQVAGPQITELSLPRIGGWGRRKRGTFCTSDSSEYGGVMQGFKCIFNDGNVLKSYCGDGFTALQIS